MLRYSLINILPAGLLFAPLVSGNPVNLHAPFTPVVNVAEGLAWPEGQALPTFATPAATLDVILVQDLSTDEQITFSALQGRINRKQPRILLLDARSEEGAETWADTAGLTSRVMHDRENRYGIISKYAADLDGVVLYDTNLSPHYRNLACTVASQTNSIPVISAVYEEMKRAGINLKVTTDLTTLSLTTPLEIYGHLYEKYWPGSVKRVIVSAKPHNHKGGGDYHHTRDIAAATGAAVVWLDTLIPEEKNLLRKFFGDMKAGDAIALGWYSTERSGISTASEFGIGTLPADFFVSASVYAGTDHKINIPPVPKKPDLENKVYVSVFISDGDNIQYTQHAMRRIWDRTASVRGKIPLNWTIAPALVDVAPAFLNYYYGKATPNDCFVTGPSGMGYMMPVNTLAEPSAPVGANLKDASRMEGYARMTETYLQRSGIRAMTIWDDADPMHRTAYEKFCRTLYGATVQNFKDQPSVAGSDENNRLHFDKLVIPYAGTYDHMHESLTSRIREWDGNAPLFLTYQANIWEDLKPQRIVELHDDLTKQFPGKLQFVRADHFFNLYNESKGMPHNLVLETTTSARAGDSHELLGAVTDGTPSTVWTAPAGPQSINLDFGSEFLIGRYVIRHAGSSGFPRNLNSADFTVQSSRDGQTWEGIDERKGSRDDVTDGEFPATSARYLKIVVTNPGEDSVVRIADIEIYGKR